MYSNGQLWINPLDMQSGGSVSICTCIMESGDACSHIVSPGPSYDLISIVEQSICSVHMG